MTASTSGFLRETQNVGTKICTSNERAKNIVIAKLFVYATGLQNCTPCCSRSSFSLTPVGNVHQRRSTEEIFQGAVDFRQLGFAKVGDEPRRVRREKGEIEGAVGGARSGERARASFLQGRSLPSLHIKNGNDIMCSLFVLVGFKLVTRCQPYNFTADHLLLSVFNAISLAGGRTHVLDVSDCP